MCIVTAPLKSAKLSNYVNYYNKLPTPQFKGKFKVI